MSALTQKRTMWWSKMPKREQQQRTSLWYSIILLDAWKNDVYERILLFVLSIDVVNDRWWSGPSTSWVVDVSKKYVPVSSSTHKTDHEQEQPAEWWWCVCERVMDEIVEDVDRDVCVGDDEWLLANRTSSPNSGLEPRLMIFWLVLPIVYLNQAVLTLCIITSTK